MMTHRLTIDKNVVKVDNYKLSYERAQHLGHNPHESAWGITQSNWHDHPLIKSILDLKGSFSLIIVSDLDLVVPTFKVNLRE
ncbi:hypothetical protein MA16_Dca020049 [Dendrobium catenatum]|uniref:Uncharacterized protein n=1 Tax=Dendrobium catenatum TaxID=906689 RepID=A0A2I0XJJ6_9ASPA|nr:hypothetical protein MA16_Dca020049 [Dendrobium catenatum]